MSQNNYQNVNAMDPRGSWEPQGALAGWNYLDRQRDFSRTRDIANESGMLSNLSTAQNIRDFQQQAPVRAAKREYDIGDYHNKTMMQPGQLKLDMLNQGGDLKAAGDENAFKVWTAAQKLPAAQRNLQLQQMMGAATILRGMGDQQTDIDVGAAMDLMEQAGLDTSRWKKDKNLAQVQKELKFIQSMDPEAFKHFSAMDQARYTQGQTTQRNTDDNATALQIAREREGKGSAAGQNVQRKNDMDDKARKVLVKMALAKGLTQEQAEDFADLQIWQTNTRDSQYGYGAKAQGSIDETQGLMDAIRGNKPAQPTMVPQPSASTKSHPDLGTMSAKDAEAYYNNTLKDGETFMWNGKPVTKGKK